MPLIVVTPVTEDSLKKEFYVHDFLDPKNNLDLVTNLLEKNKDTATSLLLIVRNLVIEDFFIFYVKKVKYSIFEEEFIQYMTEIRDARLAGREGIGSHLSGEEEKVAASIAARTSSLSLWERIKRKFKSD